MIFFELANNALGFMYVSRPKLCVFPFFVIFFFASINFLYYSKVLEDGIELWVVLYFIGSTSRDRIATGETTVFKDVKGTESLRRWLYSK